MPENYYQSFEETAAVVRPAHNKIGERFIHFGHHNKAFIVQSFKAVGLLCILPMWAP